MWRQVEGFLISNLIQFPIVYPKQYMSWRHNEVGGNILAFGLRFLARPMFLLLGSLMLLLLANPDAARINNIVIQTCTSLAFGGMLFGNLKHYEQLTGVAYGEVDPRCDDHRHRVGAAQLAGDGRIFDRFAITKPIDMSHGNWTQRSARYQDKRSQNRGFC